MTNLDWYHVKLALEVDPSAYDEITDRLYDRFYTDEGIDDIFLSVFPCENPKDLPARISYQLFLHGFEPTDPMRRDFGRRLSEIWYADYRAGRRTLLDTVNRIDSLNSLDLTEDHLYVDDFFYGPVGNAFLRYALDCRMDRAERYRTLEIECISDLRGGMLYGCFPDTKRENPLLCLFACLRARQAFVRLHPEEYPDGAEEDRSVCERVYLPPKKNAGFYFFFGEERNTLLSFGNGLIMRSNGRRKQRAAEKKLLRWLDELGYKIYEEEIPSHQKR